SGNALIARLADRQREIAGTMTGGAFQTWSSVIGLSAECRRLVDVMIVALQRMITGRVTVHTARIGDDFGSFQKKCLRPCGAIGDARKCTRRLQFALLLGRCILATHVARSNARRKREYESFSSHRRGLFSVARVRH